MTAFQSNVDKGFWSKITDLFNGMLEKLGFKTKITEDDLKQILKASYANLMKTAEERTGRNEVIDGEYEIRLSSDGQTDSARIDGQGNPVDSDGKLIVERIDKIDDISDNDFIEPRRSVMLPTIPEKVDRVIGAHGKPIIIKKNIFEKNRRNHPDLSTDDSRNIIKEALYSTNLYGQTQPKTRPNYWVAIRTSDPNRVVVLEVADKKITLK